MAFLFAPHVPRLRALGLHPAIPQMSSLGEGQSNIERRGVRPRNGSGLTGLSESRRGEKRGFGLSCMESFSRRDKCINAIPVSEYVVYKARHPPCLTLLLLSHPLSQLARCCVTRPAPPYPVLLLSLSPTHILLPHSLFSPTPPCAAQATPHSRTSAAKERLQHVGSLQEFRDPPAPCGVCLASFCCSRASASRLAWHATTLL